MSPADAKSRRQAFAGQERELCEELEVPNVEWNPCVNRWHAYNNNNILDRYVDLKVVRATRVQVNANWTHFRDPEWSTNPPADAVERACTHAPKHAHMHASITWRRGYHLLLCLFLSLCLAWLPIALSSSWRIPATEVKYRFSENSPPGQILGNVAGSAPQKSVTYAFGAPSQLFHLDPVTSELSLKAEIDAEKLCGLATWRDDEKGDPNNDLTDIVTCTPSTGELSVQLDVNAILPDGGLQAVFKVTVEVLDVDDNPPLFDNQRVWKRHLREVFYRKGRKIDLPKARDIDLLPEHRLIRYTLEQHSPAVEDTFHFEVSSSETPTLVLLKDLDAETQEYFNMTLVAFNPSRSSHYHGMYVGGRGSEQLESRLQVEIYVVDMNDNEPYFEEPSCNVTVHEDTLPGTVIFQCVSVTSTNPLTPALLLCPLPPVSASRPSSSSSPVGACDQHSSANNHPPRRARLRQ
ncbi:Protocadherin gamma-A4 [Echinococcus granulosus]|uniref:Protocadherin gamma-A4 n=1 Tax=Echinococcus granulosus TaxID=6210 RepID=W6UIQ9_ECHGR|nr:Protocadherin gamma-A4 [Echinococcus granulosus]EUB61026.1 Protocadherin gamma-A4 [Echinococcus granulosus]